MCPCHRAGSSEERQRCLPRASWLRAPLTAVAVARSGVGGLLTIPGVWGRLAITSHFCQSRFQVVCHRPSNWVQRYTHTWVPRWGCPGLSVMPPAARLRAAPRAHCPQLVTLSSRCFLPHGHRGLRPLRFHTRVPSGKGKAGSPRRSQQTLPCISAQKRIHGRCCLRLNFLFPTSRPGGDREVVGNSCGLASSRSSPEATAPLWSKSSWVWGR